jgi:hypothetical protein
MCQQFPSRANQKQPMAQLFDDELSGFSKMRHRIPSMLRWEEMPNALTQLVAPGASILNPSLLVV